ncbi:MULTISPECIES: hypothetical protein [Rhizobium]|uniref:Uncharacterized protein n=1 Tax=Rhizobium tropici TaxID=398 RepID=A0A6P1C452_RHITR|nr:MULTISPECIES: hypothetical protein [Rhizobium]MBB4241483.1 hypothetical protein [Rhizobium tropici]MBB5592777.1 hypothetical protein [Rhizobium tropici]MBB6491819.1 hypothetical protein [Rhizobium tropici]NEV11032.1 hypothetical protein [Rhizobium tropici]TGE98183.1 hypothetical protein C9417_11445 [Rhizobium sp. SEMIA 4088]
MYSLEAAIVHFWQRKTLSEEELLDAGDVGRVVFRTWLGFAGFALLILCLSWAGEPSGHQQLTASQNADRLMSISEN